LAFGQIPRDTALQHLKALLGQEGKRKQSLQQTRQPEQDGKTKKKQHNVKPERQTDNAVTASTAHRSRTGGKRKKTNKKIKMRTDLARAIKHLRDGW
jgi:hypothetical protein